jgi:hypothetical protein
LNPSLQRDLFEQALWSRINSRWPVSSARATAPQPSTICIEPFLDPSRILRIDELAGRRSSTGVLGMLGMGEVGHAIAREAHAMLDTEVLYYSAIPLEQEPCARRVDLATLFLTADVVDWCYRPIPKPRSGSADARSNYSRPRSSSSDAGGRRTSKERSRSFLKTMPTGFRSGNWRPRRG